MPPYVSSLPMPLPALRLVPLVCAALMLAAPHGAAACPDDERPSPSLVMEQGARALRGGEPLRILAIGSSTTAGVGASSAQTNFPSLIARRLTEEWGEGKVEVTNAGVSGESAPSTVGRLEAFLSHPPVPHLVIWQVGTNDVIFGGDPARLAQLVARGLDAIAASGSAALVIDQQFFPAISDLARYEAFVAAVDSATSARGVPLLRRYRMMKQWAAQDPTGFRAALSWDRFHLSDAGYACLADLITPAILAGVLVKEKPAPAPTAKPGSARPKDQEAIPAGR
ncbi:SGNH/GDSL hydrolase family protein [Xanthobacter dioxanivorans]|uniref:SGNH/GDSL hydrolase family protein n=1 Tax=Xanthobacter dioxanivorans TaxID=2528964 RepID=A0A974PKU3_9HYPH|nr:SGNH/GDSL hydrolase family protein [Xanthobacter dioxanivorans]QRG05427.1 SGNH/GDSL hydrolase family protein [Xanthobacter dioxanivorans]